MITGLVSCDLQCTKMGPKMADYTKKTRITFSEKDPYANQVTSQIQLQGSQLSHLGRTLHQECQWGTGGKISAFAVWCQKA